MDIYKGCFVKWTGKDEQGSFSYEGKVVSVGKLIQFEDERGGVYAIPKDDGKWKRIKSIKDWEEKKQQWIDKQQDVIARMEQKAAKVEQKDKRVVVPRTGKVTKKQRGKEIYQQMAGRANQAIIEKLMEELGMTLAGARTYVSNYRSGRW